MTIRSSQSAPVTVRAGRPSWRVAVAAEADRLEAQLNEVPNLAGASGSDPPAAEDTRQAIAQAREMATRKTGRHTLGDWWFGTSIESSWQALHRAAEQLVMVQPTEDLLAMRPHLESLAAGLPAGESALGSSGSRRGRGRALGSRRRSEGAIASPPATCAQA